MENANRHEASSSGSSPTQPRVRPRTRPPSFHPSPRSVSFESESFIEAYGPAAFIGSLVVVFFGSVGLLLWPSSQPDDGFLTAEELRLLTDATRAEPERSEAYPLPGRTSSLESGSDVEAGVVDLLVDTSPPGAVVSVNGDVVGVAPLEVRDLPSNWHAVAVDKEGFISQDTFLYVGGRAPARVMVALEPTEQVQRPPQQAQRPSRVEPETSRQGEPPGVMPTPRTAPESGAVDVTVSPAGATVQLNGERVGVAPLEVGGVPPGSHTLTVVLQGYETAVAEVEIEAGARESIDIALVPETGDLAVVVRPWGSIYINGTLRARDTDVRFDTSLPVGRHLVRVVHPELGVQERAVEVRPDDTTSATFYFE